MCPLSQNRHVKGSRSAPHEFKLGFCSKQFREKPHSSRDDDLPSVGNAGVFQYQIQTGYPINRYSICFKCSLAERTQRKYIRIPTPNHSFRNDSENIHLNPLLINISRLNSTDLWKEFFEIVAVECKTAEICFSSSPTYQLFQGVMLFSFNNDIP